MYRIQISNTTKLNEYEELIKLFLQNDGYCLLTRDSMERPDVSFEFTGDKNQLKAEIYRYFAEITGSSPPWGILTGIRPVKMVGEMLRTYKDPAVVHEILTKRFLISAEKADKVVALADYQTKTVGTPPNRNVGIYIGIPFCPTRCDYCSFTSNQVSDGEMERYIDALSTEIKFVGQAMKDRKWQAETIYIGGGTPTALPLPLLQQVLSLVVDCFHHGGLKEFTLEAGRPDTITADNMKAAAGFGVDRVSVNPQTMNEDTLRRIGRKHSIAQVYQGFDAVRNAGIPVINTDIIAGLPNEGISDFLDTLGTIIKLAPENVTVHSLAMKRASRLTEANKNLHFQQAAVTTEMLENAEMALSKEGYVPYYLYRQKHMAGNLENIGYCLPGTEGIYNIRIMEENQTIIALGAGGISKVFFPDENRLERVPNVSNYQIYIERLEEMLGRKEHDLFRRFEKC